MKNRYTFLALFLLTGLAANGQNITLLPGNDFEVTILPNAPELVIHAKVKNNSTKIKDFNWERTENCLPAGWISLICDKNVCYGSATNASPISFTLDPGEEGTFDIHIKAAANDGGGHLQFKITEVADATNTTTAVVKVNTGCASGTASAEILPVKLYPNPATNGWFKLENADQVAAVNLLTLDGRQLARFEATADHQYQIGDFPPASYLLLLEDKSGKNIGAMNLQKI